MFRIWPGTVGYKVKCVHQGPVFLPSCLDLSLYPQTNHFLLWLKFSPCQPFQQCLKVSDGVCGHMETNHMDGRKWCSDWLRNVSHVHLRARDGTHSTETVWVNAWKGIVFQIEIVYSHYKSGKRMLTAQMGQMFPGYSEGPSLAVTRGAQHFFFKVPVFSLQFGFKNML